MALVSQTLKNLKGGVSQQPDILRYPEQGQEQVNAFPSEVQGLIKRPPTVNVARVGDPGSLGVNPMVHLINRDETEQYKAVFNGTDIKVIDLKDGKRHPVTAPNGLDYVKSTTPQTSIRCVTVADYTFIVNSKVECEEGTTKSPKPYDMERNALVMCAGGQYSRKFTIDINNVTVAQYTTPDGSDPEHGAFCDTQYILTRLSEALLSFVGADKGWTAEVKKGYLHIVVPATADPINSLVVTDGYNGKLLTGFKYDVVKTSDLPVFAPSGYLVRVGGEAGTEQDDYWVTFDRNRNIWKEAPAPDVKVNFKDSTMPHILVRTFDSSGNPSFEFKQATWAVRAAGDDDTNPYPSFIGQSITDVFFFRNRLGLLAGENVILSESGAYFNFFPPSVAVTSDSDPIDVAVSANRVSILKYAVPFAEELLLWADHSQFVLSADGILSPTSVKLDLTTEFEVSDNARPYGIGRSVYYVSQRADYSSIRRYYAVQDVSAVRDAEDVTAHVPSYVPNGIHSVSGSGTENFVSLLTTGAPNLAFIYKFLYMDEQVLQQAWGVWNFGFDSKILSCQTLGSTMYILLDTPSGIYLQKLAFTLNTKDFSDEPYRLFMDNKVLYPVEAGDYDEVFGVTSISLAKLYGAVPTRNRYYVTLPDGMSLAFDKPEGGWVGTGGMLRVNDNLSGLKVVVGSAYEFRYVFSKFLIKKQATDGSITTEDSGRLQLRRGWVNYEQSGSFHIEVSNQGRKGNYVMTGKHLGSSDLVIGSQATSTGQFRYPIAGNAKHVTVTLTSNSPNPVSLVGAGWEGNYVRRSSGI